jgi:hypothetical protein
MNTTI